MPEGAVDQLKSLILKYTTITFVPDIDHYRRIATPKPGRCIFRGCSEPIAWEDAQGRYFLCEGHYRIMKEWIEDARRGLLPGEHPSPLFTRGGNDAGRL